MPAVLQIALMLALGAVWCFLMVWQLDARTLQVDEYLTCYRTRPGAPLTDAMHPRSYYAYVRAWAGVFGDSDWSLRLANLPPAAVAVACVAVVAWWLLEGAGSVVALALVALSSELLLYWRMARYFAPAAGGFAVLMLGAVGYMRARRRVWLAVMMAGTALTAYADYLPAVTGLGVWGWVGVWELRQRQRNIGSLVAAAVATVVLCLPAASWALQGSGMVTHPFRLDSPRTAMLKLAVAGWSLVASEVLPPWQTRAAGLMCLGSLTLLVVGVREAWRRRGATQLLVVVWPFAVAVAWVALDFIPREPPVRLGSLALHALPWALVVMALGWMAASRHWWAHAALAAVLLGNGLGLANYFGLRNHLNPQYAMSWRPVAEYLREHASEDDVIVTLFDAGFYRYYHHPGPTLEAFELQRDGPGRLVRRLRAGHRVWLITRERGSTDARRLAHEVEKALLAAGARERRHPFFPYSSRERAWRKVLSPVPTSDYYLSLLEFYLPETTGRAGSAAAKEARRDQAQQGGAKGEAPLSRGRVN